MWQSLTISLMNNLKTSVIAGSRSLAGWSAASAAAGWRMSCARPVCVQARPRSNGMATDKGSTSPLFALVQKCNCFYLSGLKKGDCCPFVIDGEKVGLVRPDMVKNLSRFPEVFLVNQQSVELNPAFRDYDERTSKVDAVLRQCRDAGIFAPLKGWRDEFYEVRGKYTDSPLLRMERAAFSIFGIRKYGVDVNGYVNHPELGACIWLQRRSRTKETWPGKWDNMVAGGLSVGYSILETAIKEAYEEAGVPQSMKNKLKSGGSVACFFESERGLFPNTEFVFDLELPVDFVPRNNDGEVDKFELLPVARAIERVLSPEFKTTSAPVFIDFLIRHGHISPDNEANYPELVELLHVPLQNLYSHAFASMCNGDH